jgi:2,4-dienoyl-CoA reductase-like NADH-dependent reductase (Old Yellow Enzyme family)
MPSLLEPLDVKGYTFRNRIVMPPMASELASGDGGVTEALISHYTTRSLHTAMTVVEHAYVSLEGKSSARQLGIDRDELSGGLSNLASAIKRDGSIALIQLNHGGARANPEVTGTNPLAPSPVLVPRGYEVPTTLTEDAMEAIVKAFIEAASRAFEAGFDGVEIHGAHGFLLNQFLSPLTNKRNDGYGRSLENRMKLSLRITREVRKLTNEKLLLYRLGADDLIPGGFTVDEARQLAVRLVDEGVDIVDVSGGLSGSRPPELDGKQGFFIPLAHQIREIAEVPVIGVGGIRDPFYADQIVREGKVDLVAVGRGMLQNPGWAGEALELLRKAPLKT